MKKFFILILFLCIITSNISAQCCSAGNPVGGDGFQDGLNRNQLRIYSLYRHSLSKDYFNENEKINVPELQRSYYDFVNLSFNYGINERMTIVSRLGYFINKKQELLINNQDIDILARGFGDLSFNFRYSLIKKKIKASQLTLSVGTIIPIGNFNERMDGILIPLSIQPSSGSFKYNFGIFYGLNSKNKTFGFSTFAFSEFSSKINKDFLEYKYGNYFQLSISATYLFKRKLLFISNFKYEYRTNDIRENEQVVESSGGSVIYFSPQIQFEFFPTWIFAFNYQIPVFKYVNGYQLTNKNAFSFGIIKNIKNCSINKN